MFEPFFTTKRLTGGSGLGLSMVHGFIMQSKGHIDIVSEEGAGTTVKLYLPRSHAAEEEADESLIDGAALSRGDETILLVEDRADVLNVSANLLKTLGYRVLEARDAATALDLFDERDDIDLLLTDLVMPGGMSGADLAHRVRKVKPELKILYATGYIDTAVVNSELMTSREKILNKPFRMEELARTVRESLDAQ